MLSAIVKILIISLAALILILSPVKADEIPVELVKKLISDGCVIPTEVAKSGGYTVKYIVSGEFSHAGQKDIAAICLRNDKAYLRIIWGGKYRCNSEIKSYGEAIDVVGKKYILSHYEAFGGAPPPKITHHGIEDMILEKASTIRYCHNGKWLELTGAD